VHPRIDPLGKNRAASPHPGKVWSIISIGLGLRMRASIVTFPDRKEAEASTEAATLLPSFRSLGPWMSLPSLMVQDCKLALKLEGVKLRTVHTVPRSPNYTDAKKNSTEKSGHQRRILQ